MLKKSMRVSNQSKLRLIGSLNSNKTRENCCTTSICHNNMVLITKFYKNIVLICHINLKFSNVLVSYLNVFKWHVFSPKFIMTSNFPKVIPSPLLIGKCAILLISRAIFDMTITILWKIVHDIKKINPIMFHIQHHPSYVIFCRGKIQTSKCVTLGF